jgi:hypothetical protein
MSASNNLCGVQYDFIGDLQKLLMKIDVKDEVMIVRRAIELQAFMVSLHYPCLTQLPVSRKAHPPALDMIALAPPHNNRNDKKDDALQIPIVYKQHWDKGQSSEDDRSKNCLGMIYKPP